jgi:hypothetical protein
MRLRAVLPLFVVCLTLREAASDRAASNRSAWTLADYKYFRRLSIDLVGRPPDRAELAAFEAPDFSFDTWIDAHLTGPDYAERIRRIYMDLLRLDLGTQFSFASPVSMLRRVQVVGPDGPVWIYYRRGQRRTQSDIDGNFCFTSSESGLHFAPNSDPTGKPTRISKTLLDSRTVTVKPWWLYADYRKPAPTDLYGKEWETRFPGFRLVRGLEQEADGVTPSTQVRVCREEAQTADTGHFYVSGRSTDSALARSFQGREVACRTTTGFQNSVECGCGPGLEWCTPGTSNNYESVAFVFPASAPLGIAAPFSETSQPASSWWRLWWSQEAIRFIDRTFENDRDVRELLTSRSTAVNGPLAQFYRFIQSVTCCGPAAALGYTTPEPLVDPRVIPSDLIPQDTESWRVIPDRGPRAAGILTMPVFLAKYGSRRARAHVLYNAFLCKSFVADAIDLTPSSEPDLTKRSGCNTCHRTLEPLAAFFARVNEADWTYWPAPLVPATMPACKTSKPPAYCKSLYDPALDSTLRGAHAALDHAELGPAGLAKEISESPQFAPCVVQNVLQSFLGRGLTSEDATFESRLTRTFVDGGYRMRALVRAVVTSRRYREGNDTVQ